MGDTKLTLPSSPSRVNDMSSVLSLYNLLLQASPLPCSSGAAAFLSLVPSENERFPLALDVLLPTLQNSSIQPSQRILTAYVLHVLYASHDHLNPFHDHLLQVFDSERTAAIALSRSNPLTVSPELLRSQSDSSALRGKNEQFIWVLWKILRGEGKDLAPYSPDILARTALPEHLRPPQLVLQNTHTQNSESHQNFDSPFTSISRDSPSTHQLTTASYQTHPQHFQQETFPSTPLSSTDSFTQRFPSASTGTQSRSKFSPFKTENEPDSAGNGWSRRASPNDLYQAQQQVQFESPRRPDTNPIRSRLDSAPTHEGSSPSPTKNYPSENLLHTLYAEAHRGSSFQTDIRTENPVYPVSGHPRGDSFADRFGVLREAGQPASGFVSGNESSHESRVPLMQTMPRQSSPTSSSLISRVQRQAQFLTTQNNESGPRSRHIDVAAASFSTSTTPSDKNLISQPQLGPIARPRPAPSLFYNSSSQEEATAVSANNSSPRSARAETYSHIIRTSPADGLFQTQASTPNGHFLKSQASPTRLSPTSMRNPGVIGSGRPFFKPISPVGSDEGERKSHVNVGVIGNGRPVRHSPGVNPDVVDNGTVGMIQRTEKGKEGEKKDFGAIGRPKNSPRGVRESLTEGAVNDTEVASAQADQGVSSVTSVHHLAPAWDPSPSGNRPLEAQSQAPSGPTNVLRAENIFSPTPSTSSSDTRDSASSSLQNHSSLPPSTTPSLTTESLQSGQQSKNLLGPIRATSTNLEPKPEKERDELSRAILLLLSARERVLTLSEQRALVPHLPMLTCPLSLLRPGDLQSLVSKNPDVAVKLLVLLLDRDDEEGARVERVLRDVTKNDLFPLESAQGSFNAESLASVGAVDAIQNVVDFVNGMGNLSLNSGVQDKVSPFGGREAREGYLEALRRLPPTMQSFNLIARLLRPTPQGTAAAEFSNFQDTPEVRVAKLVRTEVLGGLVNGCVHWIEKDEQAEREGEVLGDRVAVSVSSLSRFYTSLLKHGFVSVESEVDTTEIMSFALQFSRFEEARSLYSTLAAARA